MPPRNKMAKTTAPTPAMRRRTIVGQTIVSFEALKLLGISYSRANIRKLELEGKFPRRVALGGNSIGWKRDEIDEWLKERPRVTLR
jgi:prophage regulatory protein